VLRDHVDGGSLFDELRIEEIRRLDEERIHRVSAEEITIVALQFE
jgi:hypothetical protein